jgi:pimeloyl-ACP methyl ester carboxylesterase
MASQLQVFTEGSGPRVVLVHGSVMGGDIVWGAQTPLAERWTLVKPNRRGFGTSPQADGEDFERDADDIAALIEPGDHLVGYSYGGVISLLAAAQRADAIRSLALLDPPAFGVVPPGDPVVEKALTEFGEIHDRYRANETEAWAREFAQWVGSPGPLPPEFPPPMQIGARLAYNQRPPQDAVIPLDVLAATSFPKLVVNGDGQRATSRVGDVLEAELNADRAYIKGFGHMITMAGPPLNEILETFWLKSSDG